MRLGLKKFAVALALTTALTPAPVDAAPLILAISTTLGLFAFQAGLSIAVVNAVIAVSATLAQLAISAAISFGLNALFAPDAATAPKPSETTGNISSAIQERFKLGGLQRKGGSLVLGEVTDGKLHKLIAHGDTVINEHVATYLNDIKIILDDDNYVTNEQFSQGSAKYYKIERRSGLSSQPAMQTLIDAFPEWTVDHVGAGVADTLLTISPVHAKHRQAVLRHQGILGVGEPDIDEVAYWGTYYDPRDSSQDVNDRSTWGPNQGNLALAIAEHRMDPERFNFSPEQINWDNIAEQADICDIIYTDRYGIDRRLYEVGYTINKNKESNIKAEDRLLAVGDAQRAMFEDGTFGIRVGWYYEPTVVLTDADLYDIESASVAGGEERKTHYFPNYTENEFDYKEQTGAEIISPLWSNGDPIDSVEVPLYGCLNHNQAWRVCRAGMVREIESQRLGVQANLKALKMRSERFVRIDSASDSSLSGVYECPHIQDAADGLTVFLPLVRCDADRWNPAPALEGDRPNRNIVLTSNTDEANVPASEMTVVSAKISQAGGAGVRFVASFVVPDRSDYIVQIQFRVSGSVIWEEFGVRTEDGYGVTGAVSDGETYQIRWRVITATGDSSEYSNIIEVLAVADQTPTLAHSSFSVSASGSDGVVSLTSPNSSNYLGTQLHRSSITPADFSDASPVGGVEYGPANTADSIVDASLTSGDHHYWVVPLNGSGIEGPMSGPETITIT